MLCIEEGSTTSSWYPFISHFPGCFLHKTGQCTFQAFESQYPKTPALPAAQLMMHQTPGGESRAAPHYLGQAESEQIAFYTSLTVYKDT